jgi:hypothetical protein
MRSVKWSIRDDGNTAWGKHYHGDYIVTICDMDGDGTEWEVWLRKEYDTIREIAERNRQIKEVSKWERLPDPIAKGYVCVRAIDDFEVGQAIAIEALDGIIRARNAYEAPRRAHPTPAELG